MLTAQAIHIFIILKLMSHIHTWENVELGRFFNSFQLAILYDESKT